MSEHHISMDADDNENGGLGDDENLQNKDKEEESRDDVTGKEKSVEGSAGELKGPSDNKECEEEYRWSEENTQFIMELCLKVDAVEKESRKRRMQEQAQDKQKGK
ncbi:unnamed protein product, partial [Cuscuta europaea]